MAKYEAENAPFQKKMLILIPINLSLLAVGLFTLTKRESVKRVRAMVMSKGNKKSLPLKLGLTVSSVTCAYVGINLLLLGVNPIQFYKRHKEDI